MEVDALLVADVDTLGADGRVMAQTFLDVDQIR
jgi:hypothetical protein